MKRIKLQKLIFQPEILALLDSAAGQIALPFAILDSDGNILLKNSPPGPAPSGGETSDGPSAARPGNLEFPIRVQGEILGLVRGDEKAAVIADLVAALAATEADKKALAGETLHRYKELALLYDFTEKISARLDVHETGRLIIEEARRMIPGDNFSIMLRVAGTEDLEIVAALGREHPDKLRLRPGEGLAGRIFESGKGEIVNDVGADGRFLAGQNRVASMICVPLRARREVIGILNISSETPHEYSSEDLKLAIALALVGAGAIGNARYTQELRASRDHLDSLVARRTRRLENTLRELKRTNKFLEHISMADPLTGVGNRRSFDQLLDSEWRRAAREHRPLSLILLDLDYFKNYNDTYGHQAGDQCLVRIVNTMRASLKRPTDAIARYGGEEFAVVLANTDGPGAGRIAETLIRNIEQLGIPHLGSEIADTVTASAGVAALVPNGQTSTVELIQNADGALYAAKQGGRNRIELNPAT